jgi:CRISPR-associated endoribonuclease Cas6
MNLLFPLPTSVFGSLARKWEVFCAAALPANLDTFLLEQVAAERYELETQVVHYGGHQFNGFVGDCQFRLLHKDPVYGRAVNALAGFAVFAGVGQKTTQGLGQARRIEGWGGSRYGADAYSTRGGGDAYSTRGGGDAYSTRGGGDAYSTRGQG